MAKISVFVTLVGLFARLTSSSLQTSINKQIKQNKPEAAASKHQDNQNSTQSSIKTILLQAFSELEAAVSNSSNAINETSKRNSKTMRLNNENMSNQAQDIYFDDNLNLTMDKATIIDDLVRQIAFRVQIDNKEADKEVNGKLILDTQTEGTQDIESTLDNNENYANETRNERASKQFKRTQESQTISLMQLAPSITKNIETDTTNSSDTQTAAEARAQTSGKVSLPPPYATSDSFETLGSTQTLNDSPVQTIKRSDVSKPIANIGNSLSQIGASLNSEFESNKLVKQQQQESKSFQFHYLSPSVDQIVELNPILDRRTLISNSTNKLAQPQANNRIGSSEISTGSGRVVPLALSDSEFAPNGFVRDINDRYSNADHFENNFGGVMGGGESPTSISLTRDTFDSLSHQLHDSDNREQNTGALDENNEFHNYISERDKFPILSKNFNNNSTTLQTNEAHLKKTYSASLTNITSPIISPLSATESMESDMRREHSASANSNTLVKDLLNSASRAFDKYKHQSTNQKPSPATSFNIEHQSVNRPSIYSQPTNQLSTSSSPKLPISKDSFDLRASLFNGDQMKLASEQRDIISDPERMRLEGPFRQKPGTLYLPAMNNSQYQQASGFRPQAQHISPPIVNNHFSPTYYNHPTAVISGPTQSPIGYPVTLSSQLVANYTPSQTSTTIMPTTQIPNFGSSIGTMSSTTATDPSATTMTSTNGFLTTQQLTTTVTTGANSTNIANSLSIRRPLNLTRVEHISADCSNDMIRAVIVFNGTFKGIVYSSGYVRDSNCMYINGTGKNRYDFSIKLNECGTMGKQE